MRQEARKTSLGTLIYRKADRESAMKVSFDNFDGQQVADLLSLFGESHQVHATGTELQDLESDIFVSSEPMWPISADKFPTPGDFVEHCTTSENNREVRDFQVMFLAGVSVSAQI